MNVKEYLQQQAEKEAESLITESDREFCRSLSDMQFPSAASKQKSRRKLWATISTIGAIAATLAIVLPVVLTRPSDVVYFDDKIVSKDSTIEELQSTSKYFYVNEDVSQTRVLLYYDSVSGDNLYFTVSGYGDVDINLVVAINKNYHYTFMLNGDTTSTVLSDYNVIYVSNKITTDFDGIYGMNYRGWIKVKSEIVYFDYTQPIATSDEDFFEDIQQLIQLK